MFSEKIKSSLLKLFFKFFEYFHRTYWGFPGGSVVKNSPANARDMGSIPGSGRSPGKGNGNPPQYSCLENSVDREDWQATGHRVTQSQTRSTHTPIHR